MAMSTNWFLADLSNEFIIWQSTGGDGFYNEDLAFAGLEPKNLIDTIDRVGQIERGFSIGCLPDGDATIV